MSKYLVETFYTCTFKVKHFLDKIDQKELNNLEQRDDGEFEVIDIKIDAFRGEYKLAAIKVILRVGRNKSFKKKYIIEK